MPVSKKTGKRSKAQQDADILRQGLARRKAKTKRLKLRAAEDLTTNTGIQRKSKYDWAEARDLYMTQPKLSMKQISLRTGIPYTQIRNKAGKERWSAIRTREQMEVLKQNRQQFLLEMGREAISFDQTAIDASKVGMGIVTARLIEISRYISAADGVQEAVIYKLKNGIPLERGETWGMVPSRELVELATAAKLFQDIGRTALGTAVTDASFLDNASGSDDGVERVVSIGDELTKDDPARLAAFIEVMDRMGLLGAEGDEDEETEVTEGAIVLEGTFSEQPAIEGGSNGATT
jgi:hypothetical protein